MHACAAMRVCDSAIFAFFSRPQRGEMGTFNRRRTRSGKGVDARAPAMDIHMTPKDAGMARSFWLILSGLTDTCNVRKIGLIFLTNLWKIGAPFFCRLALIFRRLARSSLQETSNRHNHESARHLSVTGARPPLSPTYFPW